MHFVSSAKGNVAICAEFNTHCDPEAMAVVLQELDTEIRLLPLELCRSYALSWVALHFDSFVLFDAWLIDFRHLVSSFTEGRCPTKN